MPAQMTSAFRRFGNALKAFTVGQRTLAIIGVAVLVLGIAALTMWAAKPAYTPLFSGLSGTDANTIVEQLQADGISYELADGGATVMVPEADVYAQRLKSAAAGLPSDSTGGYSLLDTMGVTSSEFQQSVTYKRALEGELAATIMALDGVQNASVQLAIPEESVFVSEQGSPTASVFVQTSNSVTLSNDQVQAIVHLTSASIEGMLASDVAVVDAAGTVLSAVGVGTTGSSAQQANDYESRVRGAVQAMLDQVVGNGNATVVVAADMSTQTGERVEETFSNPIDTPALNETTETETYTGSGATAGGVLGTDTAATETGDDGTFDSESSTRNNAVNKVTESTVIPAGQINRQTVSVALNADVAAGLNVADITSLVSSAAGIDAARGDAVTVEVMAFDATGAAAAEAALTASQTATAAAAQAELIRTIVVTVGIVLAVVVSLLVYARRSRRQSREPVDMNELDALDALASKAALGGATMPIALPAPFPSKHLDAPTELLTPPTEGDLRRGEIDNLARSDPHRTADYLRSLMSDRQPS